MSLTNYLNLHGEILAQSASAMYEASTKVTGNAVYQAYKSLCKETVISYYFLRV